MMRLLYVDDDPRLREYFKRASERLGHDCVLADDGTSAFALVEAGEVFDAIVSDHDMPQMNGFELLERLHGHPAGVKMTFVLYTGTDNHQLRAAVEKLGGSFIFKGDFIPLTEMISDLFPSD